MRRSHAHNRHISAPVHKRSNKIIWFTLRWWMTMAMAMSMTIESKANKCHRAQYNTIQVNTVYDGHIRTFCGWTVGVIQYLFVYIVWTLSLSTFSFSRFFKSTFIFVMCLSRIKNFAIKIIIGMTIEMFRYVQW